MPTLMHVVWLLTVITNITLSLLLFLRGLYVKFSWLTATCVLAVFSDAVLAILRTHYPSSHRHTHDAVLFLFLSLEWMIVFEAFKWGVKWIRRPMEVMILLQIVATLCHYAGALWTAYQLNNFIGLYNLGLTIFFISMFERTRYE